MYFLGLGKSFPRLLAQPPHQPRSPQCRHTQVPAHLRRRHASSATLPRFNFSITAEELQPVCEALLAGEASQGAVVAALAALDVHDESASR